MSFVHAKDAAMGSSGYERIDADFYPTEPWCVETLLEALMHGGIQIPYAKGRQRVWEPAAGDGAISRVLERHFLTVTSSDLHDRGYAPSTPGVDFLKMGAMADGAACIITNPPYSLATEFVEHALALTERVDGMVAMLLRNEWDCAGGRTHLFQSADPHEPHPFKAKIVLTSRPRWIAGSTGAPRHNYSWFVWDWRNRVTDRRPLALYGRKAA